MKETLADLDLLSRIAHLEDATAILSQEPDASLGDAVKAFWKESQRNLVNDPPKWADYINRREAAKQSLLAILKVHSELQTESK